MDDDTFYVCLYLKDGRPIGHRLSLSANFPDKLNDPGRDDAATSREVSNFRVASKEFVDAMMGYLEYVPLILTLTPFVSHTMVSRPLCVSFWKNSTFPVTSLATAPSTSYKGTTLVLF